MEKREIGSLNGPWSVLLRFLLATYPLVILWAVWVTVSITANCAMLAVLDTRLYAVEKIEVPPSWFQQKVERMSVDMHNNFNRMEDQLLVIRSNQTTRTKTHSP